MVVLAMVTPTFVMLRFLPPVVAVMTLVRLLVVVSLFALLVVVVPLVALISLVTLNFVVVCMMFFTSSLLMVSAMSPATSAASTSTISMPSRCRFLIGVCDGRRFLEFLSALVFYLCRRGALFHYL
jgi:hypothetical protein